VAFTKEMLFQEPLSPIFEGGEDSTKLLEYNYTADNSPDRQVYMASLRNADDDELDPEYDNDLLVDVSADKRTADAPRMRTRSTEESGG
jgi:hypothetical protein